MNKSQSAIDIECRCARDGRHYIPNNSAVREIVGRVTETYITILGPRHCQKSLLLEDVKAELERTGQSVCILVDLLKLKRVDDSDFLRKFAASLDQQRTFGNIRIDAPPPWSKVADEPSLRTFIEQYIEQLGQDLTLLIDHLESIHIVPLRSLLRVLIAIYKEREPAAPYKLRVITASASSVAELPLGETSFFDISHPVWIGELTEAESRKLIDCILESRRAKIAPGGKGAFDCCDEPGPLSHPAPV